MDHVPGNPAVAQVIDVARGAGWQRIGLMTP
jgi:hypothetical protein